VTPSSSSPQPASGLPPGFLTEPPPLAGRALFSQDWRDVAFVHWRVDPMVVAPVMPAGTRPDTFGGDTFVALVPFEMRSAAVLGAPEVPYFGDFLETNVRLYSVDDAGRHGVVFASAETSRLLIALIARATVRVRYTWSRQRATVSGSHRSWTTRRRWPQRGLRSEVAIDVGPVIDQPDDLAIFLTARWGLHTRIAGRTCWMPNHHEPWTLHRASITHINDGLVAGAGITVTGIPDVPAMYSPGVHTVFGAPVVVRPGAVPG
jgi:uncharacterized protein YqjF (DUF2071 family)